MNRFHLSTLAAAVFALGTSAAFAQDAFTLTETDTIDYTNTGTGVIDKSAYVMKDILYYGDVEVDGTITVDGAAFGMTDNKQILDGNTVDTGISDSSVTNTASVDASGTGSTGVLGANVAAGDINVQDNAVSIAYADMATVLGSADATAMSYQRSNANTSDQYDTDNTASITGGSFDGASGIAGANVTAGNFNAQKNNAVVSVSTGMMAEADVWAKQEVMGAVTNNFGETIDLPGGTPNTDPVMNMASLTGAFNTGTGIVGVNISAGTNNLQANSTAVSASLGSLGGL